MRCDTIVRSGRCANAGRTGRAGPIRDTPVVGPFCRPGGCAQLCTEAGLAAAHREYRSRLLSRARRVVVDPDLAEEAVQETFVRAWRACASFDPAAGPILNWLLVITRNVAVDLVKARARRPPLSAVSAIDQKRLAPGISDIDLVHLRAELTDALSNLGAEHRGAVIEAVLRDRPYAEVADELGIPAGTVRSRVHYGLRTLRRHLQRADRAG